VKRSSVIAPLLLILLGSAFLVRNVWPEVPVMDVIGRFWPFLLIGWGALRLVEILVWASMKRPLPVHGISGGEWVLVIFLCLIGSAVYASRHYTSWLPTGRSLRGMVINMGETFDYPMAPLTRTLEKPSRIVIESFRGNARIMGGDGDQVTVGGRKTIRAFEQNEADKANSQTRLELVPQGDQLIIRTNQDRVDGNLRVSSDLEITVPKGCSLEAHGRYGDFDVRDLTGNVEINSDNAGIRLDNIGGNVRVELHKSDIVRATAVKGTVELKGRGQDVDLQNINGTVTIDGDYLGQIMMKNLAQPVRFEGAHADLALEKLPGQLHMGPGEFTASNLVGPVRLNARARDVQIRDFTQSLELNLDRGDVDLRPGSALPKMDVRTKSGDIDLALPSSAKFDLRMSTERGEAHNEFGEGLHVSEDRHRGATIEGSVGTGPQLHLQTNRGSVTVRKAEGDLKVENQ
jgi:DUF4097 and DUF4098 domain-containing protein YvlB